MTLNDVRDIERDSPLTALASAMSLDMAQWWETTAAGYFSRVTKDTILAAIEGGCGIGGTACIEGISKAELARLAERELKGRCWLPAPLRSAAGHQAQRG